MIQTSIDENSYNQRIGRNINFRFDDASSVLNSFESNLYKNRSKKMMDTATLSSNFSARYSPFITHKTFYNIQLFFKDFKNLKVVSLKRHPIDVVHS